MFAVPVSFWSRSAARASVPETLPTPPHRGRAADLHPPPPTHTHAHEIGPGSDPGFFGYLARIIGRGVRGVFAVARLQTSFPKLGLAGVEYC